MKKIAPYLVLLAGILWGMIGLFVRKLNAMGLGSLEIVTIRAIVTTVLLFIFLLLYNRKMLVIKLKDIWCFIGTGILSIVFFNYCYFKAITMTNLSVAAVLLYTAPAIVMVISAFLFRERITMVKVIALVATFVGCVLVTGLIGDTESLSFAGIMVGLGAGLGYALYSIFSRFALDRGYHSLTITFYTFFFAIFGTVIISDVGRIVEVTISNPSNIGFYALFGLISTVIPYIVYTLGLKEMENGQASIIASIEPVAATIIGILIYQEELLITQAMGIVLVLGAIIICNVKKGSA